MNRADRFLAPRNLLALLGSVGAAALVAGGCMKNSSPGPGGPATTLPSKYEPATTAPAASYTPAPAPTVKPPPEPTAPVKPPNAEAIIVPKPSPAADMTHILSKDEPYFVSMPTEADAPASTLKSGTKVLVMIPGVKYSKVTTETGQTGYTMTEGLEPISKK